MAIIGTGKGAGKMIVIMVLVIVGVAFILPKVQAWRGRA